VLRLSPSRRSGSEGPVMRRFACIKDGVVRAVVHVEEDVAQRFVTNKQYDDVRPATRACVGWTLEKHGVLRAPREQCLTAATACLDELISKRPRPRRHTDGRRVPRQNQSGPRK
jgi:hypothetical protein